MSKRAGLHMSLADVAAHQQKNFGNVDVLGVGQSESVVPTVTLIPKLRKMTIPEKEMELMLKVQLQEGKLLEVRPFGIRLAWGMDPETGKQMIYTPDFYVLMAEFRQNPYVSDQKVIEVKGPHIWPKDLIRFRGCRAEWPRFRFELHQRDREGRWNRLE